MVTTYYSVVEQARHQEAYHNTQEPIFLTHSKNILPSRASYNIQSDIFNKLQTHAPEFMPDNDKGSNQYP